MNASRIGPNLRAQLVAHMCPAIVLDETGNILFGNRAWHSFQRDNGVSTLFGIGDSYERILPIDGNTPAGQYTLATIEQGVAEVRLGVQPFFSKNCDFTLSSGSILKIRLLITRCALSNNSFGVVVWYETPDSGGLPCAHLPTATRPQA